MAWSDLESLQRELTAALSSYDWTRARDLCLRLIRMTREERSPCPLRAASDILGALRAKRRFELIAAVAEAFIFSGQNAARIRRHYAQALIDSGLLLAAEPVLQSLAADSFEDGNQVEEAHGLLGRVYKQRYVNADRPDNRYAKAAFESALAEYLQTYRLKQTRNKWHGVNVVALLHRGKADHISIAHAPDADSLAREILETLRNSDDQGEPFGLATRAEAYLALGDDRAAEAAILEYSRHEKTDAFEAASTLRQFEEVWRLRDDQPPGTTLLPVLRAARLRGEGGDLQATVGAVSTEIARVREAQSRLETNFGLDQTVTLRWYQTGLERTRSVARIERADGKGKGTGWLVRAEDFFPGRSGPLLVTNAHVINADGTGNALRPDKAVANFQGLQRTFQLDQVVWSSPASELDATFVAFKGAAPDASPLPVSLDKVTLDVPPQRVYIMGHPDGRDLEFSIHDNKLVNCPERFLHYRTPTEGGNSGSPVFEHTGWEVIGLHHAGEPTTPVSGVKWPYEANEGIALSSLIAATRR